MIHPATLGRAFSAAAHPPGVPHPWVSVSPNEREATTLDDVPGQMTSPEMRALRLKTHGGEDGLGVWADGAEAVRVVPHADITDGARWGLAHRQKSVLHWHPDAAGPMHMPEAARPFAKRAVEYVTTVPLAAADAVRHFQAHGVNYLTVVPTGPSTSRVHTVDETGALHESFHRAAGGAPVKRNIGTATFLGDWDSREKGAEVYRAVLGESERPARLSKPDHYVGHHFTSSTSAPTVVLDPNHPHNSWTTADYKSWPQRRTYFYIDPTKREGFFQDARSHYIAHIPAEGIYDADEHPLESMQALFDLPNTHKGVKWDNTIQLFHPIEAHLASE